MLVVIEGTYWVYSVSPILQIIFYWNVRHTIFYLAMLYADHHKFLFLFVGDEVYPVALSLMCLQDSSSIKNKFHHQMLRVRIIVESTIDHKQKSVFARLTRSSIMHDLV